MPSDPQTVIRQKIAASFSQAAATYDQAAAFQRQVGSTLLTHLADAPITHWLDLGCGTGHFSRQLRSRFPQADSVSLDIAAGMLHEALQQNNVQQAVIGDAERLPIRNGCLDLLFSNLAVQWCPDLSAVLAEARRTLRIGGRLMFSSLSDGTLYELNDSWQGVDRFEHINRFRSFERYRQAVTDSGMRCVRLDRQRQTLHYPDLRVLMRELKALGANCLTGDRTTGLTGRQRFKALQAHYERFRQPEGLPVTYWVVYAVLEKV